MFGRYIHWDGSGFWLGFDDMIISNRLAKALRGANFTIQHMLNGAENERSECIQGSPRDLIDINDAARRRRLKYSTVDFVVSPFANLTRDEFLRTVLPMMAWVFSFPALHAIIFEHKKRRKNGGSEIHWHVHVSYANPVSGRVNREGWAWSHAKCERISRHLEVLYEPQNILLGRHQAAVIKALREDGLHNIADAIEKAHPPGATPENRTPDLRIEQAAKLAGIDLRVIGKAVKEAYHASADRNEFSAALADHGLTLAVSDRTEKPAWVILGGPGNDFVTVLSKCLPGVKRASIHSKIGDPEDDDGRRAGHELGPEAAGDLDRDTARVEVLADRAGPGDSAPDGPEHDDDARVARVFVKALDKLDCETTALDQIMARAADLAKGAVARVLDFFRGLDYQARLWLDEGKIANPNLAPQRDATLRDLNLKGEKLYAAIGKANNLKEAIGQKISRMLGEPAPNIVSALAHKQRFAGINAKYKAAEEAHTAAELEYKTHLADAKPFQDAYDQKFDAWHKAQTDHANAWVVIAKNVRDTLQTYPVLAQFGPRALLALGMPRSMVKKAAFDPPPEDETPGDDYSGPRGP